MIFNSLIHYHQNEALIELIILFVYLEKRTLQITIITTLFLSYTGNLKIVYLFSEIYHKFTP